MKKSAMIAIVGRPSAGKSTLLNTLCGEKISIVTPSPQTTRNKIRGILNDDRGQIVFIDTPGYHHSEKKFNQQMQQVMLESLDDCDAVLYVVDSSRKPGTEELDIISILSKRDLPLILAVNKIDVGRAQDTLEAIEAHENLKLSSSVSVSAVTGDGLDALKDALYEASPEGEAMYPEEYYTDQDPEFRIGEIIRERAMLRARQELPHAIYVEIQDMETNDDEDPAQLWIRATVYVENTSQVGLVVGKGGTGIKAIRTEAQKEIGRLFPYRVHLDLRVKANPKWRRNDRILKKLLS